MSFSQYPSIYSFGHPAVKDILKLPVIVEEKIDGSQFSFSLLPSGEMVFRSKGAIVYPETAQKLFIPAIETAFSIKDKLIVGAVYRGEALYRPKHNCLAYSRAPKGGFILFDVMIGPEDYIPYDQKAHTAELLGLEVVPKLYEGKVESFEQIMSLLDRESCLGGVKIEGIVVKQYGMFGEDKKPIFAKHVSEEFKEKHGQEWKSGNPGKSDFVFNIGEIYRHENRWLKAIQHLSESGQLTNTPKDIGVLIREINLDILKEEEYTIKQKLFDYFWNKQISRQVTRGFPEFYKEYLIKNSL